MEKRKYPVGVEHYTLYEEIGEGVSAKVHRALCLQWNEVVAIKILDFERQNADLNSICREAQTMNLVDHPNLLKSHCSFVAGQYLWVVMPYMAGGSCLHILKAAFQDGFEEVAIATILREVLKGLDYLHQQGHIHRDVKAGNILIDGHGGIKLGDFGVSACLFDSGDRTRMRNTFVGTPCWMAPEVMEQLNGHDYKADIWSFGITALELAHGHAPFSKYPPMKVLLMTLQNAPPGLDYERDKKFSKSFKQMIASCLVKDPHKRPPPKRLLKHPFFKQARSNEYISRKLLEGLPGLGDRMKALKEKEEDMLAQKKMLDGEKEELSQNEYKRGISDWNFNLEDVKAQASLISDDDILYEKDNNTKYYERQLSSSTNLSHISETDEDHYDLCSNYTRTRSEKSDDDATSMASSNYDQTPQCCSPRLMDGCEHNTVEIPHMDIATKVVSTHSGQHVHRKGSFSALSCLGEASPAPKAESEKVAMTISAFDGGVGFTLTDTAPSMDISPVTLKTIAANSEEVDEKARPPVIQQKGRFKVTSGNVELEKVSSSAPVLHKSHSLQVISQNPTGSHASSPLDHSPANVVTSSMSTMLHSFLQTNIAQRESILSMMKHICTAELPSESHVGSGHSDIVALERSMLEAAHDREKELLHEIADLQWRLICAQEELQKMKAEHAQVNH